ncbi:MAG: hypothetical protein ABI666_07065 [Ferruginibacter sp.]
MLKIIQFVRIFTCSVILALTVITANAQEDSAINLPNFLFPGFTKSVIKLKSGQLSSAVLNYNVVDQEMVFRQNEGYMVLSNPQLVDTVYIANRIFIPFKIGFYELVMAGPATLFIQHKSDLESVGTPTGYGATSQTTNAIPQRQIYGPAGSVDLRIPDGFKIVDKTEYWVRKSNQMDKFSTKRQFLKIFKDKEKELTQFIDHNDIRFKNINDIVKLFNYCNELYN